VTYPILGAGGSAARQLRQYVNDFGLTPAGERNVSKEDDDRDRQPVRWTDGRPLIIYGRPAIENG
jgi:hypothetical protein